MLLSKGEAMFDIVINDIEFKQLQSLESQYSQIKVVFDPSFEHKVGQMVRIANPNKPDSFQNKSNEMSGDITTNAETTLVLPSFSNDEMMIPIGSKLQNNLNLSRISFDNVSPRVGNQPIKDISQEAIEAMEEAKQIHMQYEMASSQSNNSMIKGKYPLPELLSPVDRFAPATARGYAGREFDVTPPGGKRNSSGKRAMKKAYTIDIQSKFRYQPDTVVGEARNQIGGLGQTMNYYASRQPDMLGGLGTKVPNLNLGALNQVS